MAVQGRSDFTNYAFWLSGRLVHCDSEVIAQIGGRSTDFLRYTLMAQNATTGKWVPLTSLTAQDGTNTARGIYVGDQIPAAQLAAGDVANCPIVVGGDLTTFDASQLVIENSLTLASVCSDTATATAVSTLTGSTDTVATVITEGAVNKRRVQDDLARIGLYAEATVDIDNFEN